MAKRCACRQNLYREKSSSDSTFGKMGQGCGSNLYIVQIRYIPLGIILAATLRIFGSRPVEGTLGCRCQLMTTLGLSEKSRTL